MVRASEGRYSARSERQFLFSGTIAILIHWLAAPVKRIGHADYSAAELKPIQEVITLVVFVVFSVFYLKEGISWNHVIGFARISGGAANIFPSLMEKGQAWKK